RAGSRGLVTEGFRVMPFQRGGITDGPELFPLRGAVGVRGEGGFEPEAVLPLKRGDNGELGVQGGGGVTIGTIVVQTPNLESFRKSDRQLASSITSAMRMG